MRISPYSGDSYVYKQILIIKSHHLKRVGSVKSFERKDKIKEKYFCLRLKPLYPLGLIKEEFYIKKLLKLTLVSLNLWISIELQFMKTYGLIYFLSAHIRHRDAAFKIKATRQKFRSKIMFSMYQAVFH